MPAQSRLLEQIKFHTELMRFLWILLVAVGGGTTSVLRGDPNSWKSTTAVIGLLGEFVGGILFAYDYRRIRRLIHQLDED